MSFLTVVNEVADVVSLDPFTAVAASGEENALTMKALANEAGEEIATRIDWNRMIKTSVITSSPYTAPADFHRMVPGSGIVTALGVIVRPVTNTGQWSILTQVAPNQPYYYRSENTFKVLPTTAAESAVLNYVSKNWVADAGITTYRDEVLADSDIFLFAERLLVLGIIWRWKRQKGHDYSDALAEFEAALQIEAKSDRGTS